MLVAGVTLLLEHVLLEEAADRRTFGQQQRQAGTNQIARHVQLKLAADFAVVAASGFFDALEIVVEFRLRFEHGAIDALEHRPLLVAAPVRAGDAGELERRDLRRAVDVRAFAQVEKRALLVERHVVVGDAFD